MFNFSKVGEKIAIIDKSLKYKRQNKVYMNNKSTDDEFYIRVQKYIDRLMMVSLSYHQIKT